MQKASLFYKRGLRHGLDFNFPNPPPEGSEPEKVDRIGFNEVTHCQSPSRGRAAPARFVRLTELTHRCDLVENQILNRENFGHPVGVPVRMLQFLLVIKSAGRYPRAPSPMEVQLCVIILVDLGVKSVTCKLRKSL